MDRNLEKAIEVIKNGGIVIFPTDTAFGIGCRIDRESAVERVFEIRRRPKDKAVPVLADSIGMVEEYVEPFDQDVRELMENYWPGGLTLVLNCRIEKVPSLVRGNGDTIGVRIPDHDLLLKIISEVGVPILGPSANFAGGKTPFELSELAPELVRKVDFVLEGSCKTREVSTVLDVTRSTSSGQAVRPWRVIRQGAVSVRI